MNCLEKRTYGFDRWTYWKCKMDDVDWWMEVRYDTQGSF